MLYSEIRGWHWAITWDNPIPSDSTIILKALGELGKITEVSTKTTIVLAPKYGVGYREIRKAILDNLDKKKGNAFYVNLRSGKAFQWSKNTKNKWKKVN